MKNLKNIVYDFKTKNKSGFTPSEEKELLEKFPNINKDQYGNALNGITGEVIDGELITYHVDIIAALKCGIENRNMTSFEWD